MTPARRDAYALLAAACAGMVFLAITTYRLERPGLYYEEVHQATGAFAYVGRPTGMFSILPIRGIPLMNMAYTGAIKTAIYGVYLRASGRPFSVASWRLLGIMFGLGGIVAFGAIAGGRIPLAALILFFLLLLTDTNFLLQSRHDWGPAALAFFVRMIFIGVSLRVLTGRTARPASIFRLGVLVGIAVFEKLTSIVLLAPLALILLADSRTRAARHFALALAGVAVGALPVLAVNAWWLVSRHTLLMLSSVDTAPGRSILGYAANYLAVGNGRLERRMMFDVESPRWSEWLEGGSMAGLLLVVGIMAWKRAHTHDPARLAGIALICYLAIGIGLRALPHRTAEHHWILGTPFNYLALALGASAFSSRSSLMTGGRVVIVTGLCALFVARAAAMLSAFEATRDDKYSATWDPSLTTAAAFAAARPDHAVFIAANWGIAAQVACLANGRPDFVFDPFWHYQGRVTLDPILAPPDRETVIAAAVRPREPITPGEVNTLWQITEEIFDNLASSTDWKETAVDPSVRGLRAVEIRVFRRVHRRDRGSEQAGR